MSLVRSQDFTRGNTMAEQEGGYVAEERLYLDEAGRVVKQDNPEKRTLLAAVGQTVPAARAKELGLIKGKAVDVESAAKPSAPTPEPPASQNKTGAAKA
jgi:hypothetical protein